MSVSPTPFTVGRRKRGGDRSNPAQVPDLAAVLTASANKLRVTLPQGFSLDGLPHFGASGGAHVATEYPLSATIVSSLVVDLAYANVVAAGNIITIESKDPAIRFRTGAFVAAQTKTLA